MKAIVNVGLLLQRIKEKGWSGVDQAAANCHVATSSFHKLMRGEIPRLDSLFRICDGCGIQVKDLIVGSSSKAESGEKGRAEPSILRSRKRGA